MFFTSCVVAAVVVEIVLVLHWLRIRIRQSISLSENMSEGGVYPWKRNSNNKAVRAPDYQRLLRPLPNPPAGLSWVYDEGAPEKWILVADTNTQAVQVVAPGQDETEISHQADKNGNEWTSATGGVATRVVPFETEASLAAPRTTEPSAVFAQATIATASITTVSSDETNNQGTVHGMNHDEQEEGVAMLPKARMIVAVGTTPPPAHGAPRTSKNASSSVSTDKTFNQKDNDKLLPDYQQEYTQHIVMPTDTLAGICLRYKISRRDLQRVNKFYGNDLRLAPCQLCIPITLKARQVGWKPQDVNSPEVKMATLLAQVPSLSSMEATW